ncbi:SEC18 [Hepatospora eriocheir]|uniref:Vesicular-fusion protein SEC18 n=1 Tax=Hepatospora eriocheir TaxID=1081669 RepID=A0A1X0QL58_9MICR|nr:SEC18 [Hepatospora eriocheir]
MKLEITRPNTTKARKAYLYSSEIKHDTIQYVILENQYLCTMKGDKNISKGQIAMNNSLRRFIGKKVGDNVYLEYYKKDIIDEIELMKINILAINKISAERMTPVEYDSELLISEIKDYYMNAGLNNSQVIDFCYEEYYFYLEIVDMNILSGMLTSKTNISLESNHPNLILNQSINSDLMRPDFAFEKLDIGGLKKEFEQMFRRAFVQRLFDPKTIQKLGIPHVKGIMLYGPPGTGKTLIARKLGSLLNSRAPKIVNGPEILNKYVGQSEENIRNLFAEAENEYKMKGDRSQLHIIIFDEIDAICKKRGSDSSGVGDKVVNQLLSKIDGVDSLNNILVIGMTNRLDLIDDALLRPGRFEIKLEISLPNLKARQEIFQIHTKQMQGNNFLDENVNLESLSKLTKNYTGAEIAAVVRNAVSFSLQRKVQTVDDKTVVKDEKFTILENDLLQAIREIKPAFGVDESEMMLKKVLYETTHFVNLSNLGKLQIDKLQKTDIYRTSSLLFYGNPGTGKTTLAVRTALSSQFPFIKIIKPKDLVGLPEHEKVNYIKAKFNDAYKSEESIIVLDEIESLIEYVNIGPRFSNNILQALKIFIKEESDNKLFVIGTTSQIEVMAAADLVNCFSEITEVKECDNTDFNDLCEQDSLFKSINFTKNISIRKLLNQLEIQ